MAVSSSSSGGSGGHLGERRLTTLHAVGQALAIGPIFSAGLVSGLVANAAGWNTPLSVLLGTVGALCLGYVIAIYARRFAGAGAIFEYLAQAVHNSFGLFSAGVFLLGTLFLGAGGIYIGLGFLTDGFFNTHLHADIPWWLGGAVALVIAFTLNHFGVRIAVQGVLALAAFSTIPFIILSLSIIFQGGADVNTLSVFDPGQTSGNAIFNGVLFAVTLFIGFEAAASIAEETHEPRKSIPRAVLLTVALSGAFYLLVTYAATIGFGKEALAKGAWFASPSPMGDLAQQYVGSWLSVLVDLVVILDALSLAIAILVTASRVIFALGRDGLLPRWTARTSRFDTPVAGNLIIVVWAIALMIWAGVTHYGKATQLPDEIQAFFIAAATGSYLVELVYVFLAIFAFKLLWQSRDREGGLWWKMIVVIVGLATPILAYKGSLDPWPKYPTNRGIYFALGCLVIALVWYLIVQFTRPAALANAARHAVEHEGVPPLDEPLHPGDPAHAGGYLKD